VSATLTVRCDCCAKALTWDSSTSASAARKYVLSSAGWKTKRSAKIEYASTTWDSVKGEHVPITKTYTVTLDFCPDCVARGAHRKITKRIV